MADVSYLNHESTIQRECKEYFASIAFAELSDQDFIDPIKNKLAERNKDVAASKADSDNGQRKSQELRAIRQLTRPNPPKYFYPMASVSFVNEANKIEDGLAQKIREFYDDLINTIMM